MKVPTSAIVYVLVQNFLGVNAFVVPSKLSSSYIQQHVGSTRLCETKEENDAMFAAFADSLDDDDDMFDEEDELSVPTWQESLEELLDPSTSQGKRQLLLSDLLNSNEDIRSDVQAALMERKIDSLLSPRGKKLQDATKAVARQITTDILPGIAEMATSDNGRMAGKLPSLVPKIGSSIFGAVSNQAKKQLELLQGDLANPTRIPERLSKQTADIAKEARNIFLETPEDLVGPSYKVIEEADGYEIRDYQGYTVASTNMAKVGEPYSVDDVVNGGAAFNTLAAYIFGANDSGTTMEMTTPVSTTSFGEMRFYLKSSTDTDFPEPLNTSTDNAAFNEECTVKLVDVPPARLAVAKFTGFVTEGEVQRQKDALLSALSLDNVEIDVPHGAVVPHLIFQYNPPYTIPIVRRNEIAVPVRGLVLENEPTKSSLESEWGASDSESEQEEDDGSAPSDVE